MFGKISDVFGLIILLFMFYVVSFGVIIPITKAKKIAKEYKIIGAENVACGVLATIGATVSTIVSYFNENTLLHTFSNGMLLLFIYKIEQFVIFSDNKYGFGKNAINFENVERVKFIDIFMYENTEFYFKDGTIKKIRIPKKIFKETQQEINTRLEQKNSNFDLGTRVED